MLTRVSKRCRGAAAVGCLAALAVPLAACGSDDGQSATSSTASAGAAEIAPPAAIADAGRLIFCSDLNYPPLEFREGGEPAGADVEVAQDLAGRLGVDAEFSHVGFDGIIAALQTSKCDAIISGMNVTPERREEVDFVEYGTLGTGVIVQAGNPQGIESVDDLAGKTVAVQLGTSNKDLLEEEVNPKLEADGQPPIEIVSFPQNTDAVNALRTARVDAYAADAAAVAYTAREQPDTFEFVGDQIGEAPVGIALRKDDPELAAALQKAVDAAYDDGAVAEIFKTWGLESMLLPEPS